MLEKELILPTNPPTPAEVIYGLEANDGKSQLIVVKGHYPAFGQPIHWPKREERPDQTVIYRYLNGTAQDDTVWRIQKQPHDNLVGLGRIHTKHIPMTKEG